MAGFALKPALQLWWKAVRPYAYSASLVPVAIGGFYARFHGGDWSPVRFGVALLAGLLVHTAANLWNDYYDFKSGVDHAGGGGQRRAGGGRDGTGSLFPGPWFARAGGLLGIWLITQWVGPCCGWAGWHRGGVGLFRRSIQPSIGRWARCGFSC